MRWEWHSLDHVAASRVRDSRRRRAGRGTGSTSTRSILEPDGDILISARNTWAGYQLEGGTGKILWRLGGLKSSFAMGPGTKTAWQHDGRMLPDGEITLLRRRLQPAGPRAVARGADRARPQDTQGDAWSPAYTHPGPPLLAASQGNMQTLPDGNVVVGYGGVPQISEYSAGGSLLFDAHLPYDMAFYRGFRFPWSGRPPSPPAVVADLNNTGEETIVHMSWNGATGVASWRVLAGKRAGSRYAADDDRGGRLRELDDPAEEVRLRGGSGARLRRPRAGDLAGGAVGSYESALPTPA